MNLSSLHSAENSEANALETLLERRKSLDIARTALSNEAGERIAQLGRERNSLMHINTLPFELTADILLQSLVQKDHRNLDRLHKLALVQSSWWRIIMAHPSFWTTIFPCDPRMTTLKLQNSRRLPLEIICDEGAERIQVELLVDMLVGHEDQIQSLDYSGHDLPIVADLLESAMPRLERMVLTPGELLTNRKMKFLCGTNLRHLELDGVPLRWNNEMRLQRLKTLTITGNEVHTISPNAFADALASCFELEELSLKFVECESPGLPPPTNLIHLPQLRSLWIEGTEGTFIIPILFLIHADRLSEFSMTYDSHPQCGPIARGLLDSDHPPPSFASLLTNPRHQAQSIDVEIQDISLEINGNFQDLNAEFYISWHGDRPRWLEELAEMRRCCLSECGIPIHAVVVEESAAGSLDRFRVDFVPFLGLKKLDLQCGLKLSTVVIRTFTAGASRWPSPDLNHIQLDCMDDELPASSLWWGVLAGELERLVERRNSSEARAAGVSALTLYAEGRGVTDAEDVRSLFPDNAESDEE